MCKILFIVLVFSLTIAEKADAFIWSFGGEKLIEVEDLPDTDEWLDEGGIYQDAYVIYKQAWILWIPILNWDARYVLSSESGGDLFYEFADPSDKDRIVSRHGPPSSAIPFWDKVGGKMVWVAIAVILAFLNLQVAEKTIRIRHIVHPLPLPLRRRQDMVHPLPLLIPRSRQH